jgi:hypothetical protein
MSEDVPSPPQSSIILYQTEDGRTRIECRFENETVGYRVRSHRGTQFRQWGTARLSEYLVKGFTMDDERLKTPTAALSLP